jgi:hypothetical protein
MTGEIRDRSTGGTPPEETTDRAARAARQKPKPNLEDTMKAMTKGLLTIALLAATAACDGAPTASSSLVAAGDDGPAFAPAPSSSLTFSSTASGSTATPQSSSGGAGSISFAGSITTSTPCYEVTASHTDRRGDITVTVTANDAGGICTQVITNHNYQGAVTGLAAGTYNFTVVHADGGSRTTVHTSTVVVQ